MKTQGENIEMIQYTAQLILFTVHALNYGYQEREEGRGKGMAIGWTCRRA
jgi:hypothetical protein